MKEFLLRPADKKWRLVNRRLAVLAVAAVIATLMAPSGFASAERSKTPMKGQNGLLEMPGSGLEDDYRSSEDFLSGEIVVGLKESGTESTASIGRAAVASGGRVKDKLNDPKNTAMLLKFPSGQAAQAAGKALAKRADVEFVERNGIVKGSSVSSDPKVGYQWHHTVIRKTTNLGTLSSAPPTIAVVDSGVDYNHPDLASKVIPGPDFVNGDWDPKDDQSHGTHVAGIAAATAANGYFGEGVSPNSKILAIKVLGADNRGNTFDMAQGLAYARTANTSPATRIINVSAFASVPDYNPQVVANEVATIKAAGKILVAAANNDNSTAARYPGADPNTALRVAATNQQDCRWAYSNFSPASDPIRYNIAAPGKAIFSTVPNGGFDAKSGTSMATPMVSGAAALVWGRSPGLTRDQVVSKLVSTGDPTSCGFPVAIPRLDVRKALLGNPETSLVGSLLDPATGSAPSPESTPLNAKLFSGSTLLGSDATTEYGFYEITELSSGTGRKLKSARSGYVRTALRMPIGLVSGQVKGPFTDAVPQARAVGDVTVTIDWKTTEPIFDTPGCVDTCNGWEFDLSVKLPDATYVDPVSKDSPGAPPFVTSPRDSLSDGQPMETVVVGSQAADGDYSVFVGKPADANSDTMNPSWRGSQASVQLYDGATSFGGGLKAPPSTCETSEFWHVGDLTKSGNSYTWTDKNLCTNTRP